LFVKKLLIFVAPEKEILKEVYKCLITKTLSGFQARFFIWPYIGKINR
jgi:hypothetical protein